MTISIFCWLSSVIHSNCRMFLIKIFFLLFFVGYAFTTQCRKEDCAKVTCPPAEPCHKEGYIYERGGYCLCCKYCKKLIGIDEDCSSTQPDPLGEFSTTVKCANGLLCHTSGKCRPGTQKI